MPHNVEIKARVHDRKALTAAIGRLGGGDPEVIAQHDTFYAAARGRLKLRRFADGSGELIAYDRPDQTGPSTSTYTLHRTDDAASLDAALAAALDPIGDVRKVRHLWLLGRTRVHLDTVEGLGDFLELEVVLQPDEDPAAGEAEAGQILSDLLINVKDMIAMAYVDMLSGAEK